MMNNSDIPNGSDGKVIIDDSLVDPVEMMYAKCVMRELCEKETNGAFSKVEGLFNKVRFLHNWMKDKGYSYDMIKFPNYRK